MSHCVYSSLCLSHCGFLTVAVSLWLSHCGVLTVAVSLWLSHCDCLTVTVSLWLSYCGCLTVAVSLWRLTVAVSLWPSQLSQYSRINSLRIFLCASTVYLTICTFLQELSILTPSHSFLPIFLSPLLVYCTTLLPICVIIDLCVTQCFLCLVWCMWIYHRHSETHQHSYGKIPCGFS